MAQKIQIDGKEYDLEALPQEARVQIVNIQYVDQKIADLQSQLAVMNAAKQFYLAQLKAALPQEANDEVQYGEE